MAVAGSLSLLTAFTRPGNKVYGAIVAPYPGSWLGVRPGMTSDEARILVGAPTFDGDQLKAVDRWIVEGNGVELNLDLWFSVEGRGDAKIERVGLFKHLRVPGSGRFDERTNPPWP